jgi:chromosome segregation ATPase
MKIDQEFNKIRDAFKQVRQDIASIKSKFIASDLDISDVRKTLSADIKRIEQEIKRTNTQFDQKIASQNLTIKNHKKAVSKENSEASIALKESIESFDKDIETVQKNSDILREEFVGIATRQENHEKLAKKLDISAEELKQEAQELAKIKRELKNKIESIAVVDQKITKLETATKTDSAEIKNELKQSIKAITALEKATKNQRQTNKELAIKVKEIAAKDIQKDVTQRIEKTVEEEFASIKEDIKNIAQVQEKVHAESNTQKEALAKKIEVLLKENQTKESQVQALQKKIESLEKDFEKKLEKRLKKQADAQNKEFKQMVASVSSAKNKKDLKNKLKKSNGNTFKDFMFNLFFEEVPEKTRAEKISKEQPKGQKANN